MSSGENVQGDRVTSINIVGTSVTVLEGKDRAAIDVRAWSGCHPTICDKPASATVMSRFSGKQEGPNTLYNRYSSFSATLASACLLCASLRYALDCVGILAAKITGWWGPSFLMR